MTFNRSAQPVNPCVIVRTLAVLVIAVSTLLASDGEEAMEIARSTIDGGGVMKSTGGGFELSATIGQPDAGVAENNGYTLTGGFWFELPPTDCNDDGLIGLFDHETLTSCMLGPGGGIGAGPCPCFDVDRDGHITLNDYAQLQAGFTGQE